MSNSSDPSNNSDSRVSGSVHHDQLKLPLAVLVFSVFAAAISQLLAPYFDHQRSNFISLGLLAAGFCFLLFRLHLQQRHSGRSLLVPGITFCLAIVFVVCFRFEGFSGEMLPQFRFRFSQESKLPMRDIQDVKQLPRSSSSATTDDSSSQGTHETEPVQSTQFLGNTRNGIIVNRAFAIPNSDEEVEILWSQKVGPGWGSFSVAQGLAVTLEQRGEKECVTCYQLSDGKLRWIQEHTGLHQHPLGGVGPRSTPTIVDNLVFASSATGHVWCLDLQDGQPIWETELNELAAWDQTEFEDTVTWGYAASPVVSQGRCVLPIGGPRRSHQMASLIALDTEDGHVLWRGGHNQISYASPMIYDLGGEKQVVTVNESSVSGHDLVSGKQRWEFEWQGSSSGSANCASAILVDDDKLLVGKGYGGGSVLTKIICENDFCKTEEIWRSNRLLKTKFTHTCVMEDVGFGISNGAVEAVSLSEARSLWRQPRRSRSGQGQMLLAEDHLVIQNESGDIVFAEANRDAFVSKFKLSALSSKTWNIPTIAGRYLLVRNDRQAICFRLPAR